VRPTIHAPLSPGTWAVPVAAAVVSDADMATVFAAFDMAAECGGTAVLDRRHHLQMVQA